MKFSVSNIRYLGLVFSTYGKLINTVDIINFNILFSVERPIPEDSTAGIQEVFLEENAPVRFSENVSAGIGQAAPGQDAEPLF